MIPELTTPPQPDFRSSERLARASLLVFAASLLTDALSMMTEQPVLGLICAALQWIAFLIGLVFLMRFSRLRESSWRFIFVVLGLLLMLGALAKLQHWGVAAAMISLPYGGIAIAYLVWTFQKPQRALLDYLKLAWVVFFAVAGAVRLQHWNMPGLDVLAHLAPYLFQVLVWLQWRQLRQLAYRLNAEGER